MPVTRLMIRDVPVIAWTLQEALRPLLPIPVQALGSEPALPPDATDVLLLTEILLPGGGCGLAEAMRFKQGVGGAVAVMGVDPLPLYAWVAWELHMAGCLDKSGAWEEFVEGVRDLVKGQSVWSVAILGKVEGFEEGVGWRLRRLKPRDWERWKDLMEERPLKALALHWGLSRRGVLKAIEGLCGRLGVRDHKEACALALEAGVMHPYGGRYEWASALALWREAQRHLSAKEEHERGL